MARRGHARAPSGRGVVRLHRRAGGRRGDPGAGWSAVLLSRARGGVLPTPRPRAGPQNNSRPRPPSGRSSALR
eukprot:4106249-Pyramimonas_sp.AAC.1